MTAQSEDSPLAHRAVEGVEFMPAGWCGGCETCAHYPVPMVCLACSYPGNDPDGWRPVNWPCAIVRPRGKRIQRQRSKGWRMPEDAVYVGRPTVWGNPFVPDADLSVEDAVRFYRDRLLADEVMQDAAIKLLAGRDLACWCPLDRPCHADVLLDFVAKSEDSAVSTP